MAKSIATCSLLVPCTAFVPQGGVAVGRQGLVGKAERPVVTPQSWTDVVQRGAAPSLIAFAGAAAGLGVHRCRQETKAQPVLALRVVGISPPINEKWDPLNLGSTEQKMERYTAVEIKHGRISMLACIGYVMPEIFRFPGCEQFKSGLGALSTLPAEGWVQLVLFIGAHEVLVKPRPGGLGSFDFGLGTELLEGISDEELERKQTAERNNGRLAMAAIIGLMWQDGTFGASPIYTIATDGLWGPGLDRFVQYIPQCNSLTTGRIWC